MSVHYLKFWNVPCSQLLKWLCLSKEMYYEHQYSTTTIVQYMLRVLHQFKHTQTFQPMKASNFEIKIIYTKKLEIWISNRENIQNTLYAALQIIWIWTHYMNFQQNLLKQIQILKTSVHQLNLLYYDAGCQVWLLFYWS